MFSKNELITFLRSNLIIADSTEETEYLKISDDDLVLYLRVALTKDFPEVEDIEEIDNTQVYALILSAKLQLYQALAVKYAPKVDISADTSNSLKNSQKYEHFKELYEITKAEYNDFIDSGGAGGYTLYSTDVLLATRYRTKRNYDRGATPVPYLYTGEVTKNSIELDWEVHSLTAFESYKVYISTEPFLDLYADPHIGNDLKPCTTIKDVHHNYVRVVGLEPSTTYFVAVTCTDMSGHIGYSKQLSFTTLSEEVVSLGD